MKVGEKMMRLWVIVRNMMPMMHVGIDILLNIILNLTAMDSAMDSDTNFNYYHEYCRAYLSNIVLLSQMRELVNERNELSTKFIKL